MQHDPLCCDPLDSGSSRQQHAAGHKLVPTFHLVPCLLVEGEGSDVRMYSILPPDVSTCHSQSAFKLATIWRLRRRRRPWLHVGSWSMETLVSTSLHMYAKIHVLFYAYCALVLGIIHWRSMKSATSFVGVVGGRRGIRVLLQS